MGQTTTARKKCNPATTPPCAPYQPYRPDPWDMECCLVTLRDFLRKMKPTPQIGQALRAIDRTLDGK